MRARVLLVSLTACMLAGCSVPLWWKMSNASEQHITFVGVSRGDQSTLEGALSFEDRYPADARALVGVAKLDAPLPNARAVGTWYLREARSPAFGSSALVLDESSTLLRFNVLTPVDWTPTPLLFTVDIRRGSQALGSGSTQIFLGMSDDAIRTYREEAAEAVRRETERRNAMLAPLNEAERYLVDIAGEHFSARAVFALRLDVTGDGNPEYLFIDTRGQPALGVPTDPSLLLEAQVRQAVLLGPRGTALFLLKEENGKRTIRALDGLSTLSAPPTARLRLQAYPSGRMRIAWDTADERCSVGFATAMDGVRKETGTRCEAKAKAPVCSDALRCALQDLAKSLGW